MKRTAYSQKSEQCMLQCTVSLPLHLCLCLFSCQPWPHCTLQRNQYKHKKNVRVCYSSAHVQQMISLFHAWAQTCEVCYNRASPLKAVVSASPPESLLALFPHALRITTNWKALLANQYDCTIIPDQFCLFKVFNQTRGKLHL